MKLLKTFFFTLIASFIISCSSCDTKKTDGTNTYSATITSIKNLGVDTLNSLQIDSLTKVDKLPAYSKWNKSYMRDGDTNKAYEYATLYDKSTGIIYTVKYLREQQRYVVQKKKTTSK